MTRLWRVTLCEIEKANEFNTTRHKFFSKYGTFLAAGIARAPDVTRIWNGHRKYVYIETYCTLSEKLMLIESLRVAEIASRRIISQNFQKNGIAP